MLAEILNIWNFIYYASQGLLAVLIPVIKCLFTMPFLPFTLIGLLSCFVKRKCR